MRDIITITEKGINEIDVSAFGAFYVNLEEEEYFKIQGDDNGFYVALKGKNNSCRGCALLFEKKYCQIMCCVVKGNGQFKYKRVPI